MPLVEDGRAVVDVDAARPRAPARRRRRGAARWASTQVGEAVEEAADDDLLLGGEEAAGAVGHRVDALVGWRRGRGRRRAERLSLSSRPASARPSCLHGVHCPHDSTARKRDTPAATATRSSRSSKHDEAGRAEPAADRGHALVAERRVERVGRDERVRDAGQDGDDRAAGQRRRRRSCSITSRSGVPIMNSADARLAARCPVTVHTIVPGDSSVPSVRNHEPPRAMMPGTLARVSTLSTRAGGASVVVVGPAISTWLDWPLPLARVGGRSRPPRRRPGGRAARCGGRGSGRRSSRAAPSPRRRGTRRAPRTPTSSMPSAPARPPRPRRPPRAPGRRRRPNERLSPNDDLVGADGEGGDERAFDHLVGVEAQDRAVLERAGLALGPVDDHGGAARSPSALAAHRAPLDVGREPGARRGHAGPTPRSRR